MHLCLAFISRQEFVDAYVDYIFNKSVASLFDAFHTGFHKVCGGKVLLLFQPNELQAMVIGNTNYDWKELEKVRKNQSLLVRVEKQDYALLSEISPCVCFCPSSAPCCAYSRHFPACPALQCGGIGEVTGDVLQESYPD